MASEGQPQDTQSEEKILSQAEALASQEEWKQAASLVREYQKSGTLSVNALGKLAYYCSRAGDSGSALTIYHDLCQQQPSEAKWFYGLGFQYQQKEEWPDAIAAYEHSVHLAPRWLKAPLKLGDAYQGAGQLERALGAYRKGIQSYQELSLDRPRGEGPSYRGLRADQPALSAGIREGLSEGSGEGERGPFNPPAWKAYLF